MVLRPLPEEFASTREALHLVAERLVAPARKPDNEIALTPTPGGFGTPPFALDGVRIQVRVEGGDLVVERDGVVRRGRLDSLAGGARLLGPELLPDGMPDDEGPLAIDPAAAERLAELFAFAARALETFRGGLRASDEPSAINLWPEHFDIAFESGPSDAGGRANYGVSPGDAEHPEPYLYVGPWTARPEGELWNASAFPGAELAYADLCAAADPEATAIEFMAVRRAALDE
jgi:hypothetical protein